MNVENNVVVEETVKPKRVRKPIVKIQKSGADIVTEISNLQAELTEMENASEEVAPSSLLRPMIDDALNAKREQLTKAINTVYTV